MAKRFQLILCGIFFVLFFISSGVSGYLTLTYLNRSSEPGWVCDNDGDGHLEIVHITSQEAASLLQVKDEVLAVNDQNSTNPFEFSSLFRHIKPNQPYTVLVRRNNQLKKFTLTTSPISVGIIT